jgi:pyrroline-5-carboxylate reductase
VSTEAQMELAEGLLSAVGQTVRLDDEAQMDAVTGVSGSGPAYVFHLIEALAAAGEAEGLAPELALRLADRDGRGRGRAGRSHGRGPRAAAPQRDEPERDDAGGARGADARDAGLTELIRRTVAAAAARSRELGK